jgi:voltage-gated potassium channel
MPLPLATPSARLSTFHLFMLEEHTGPARFMRIGLVTLILCSVVAAVVKSVPSVGPAHGDVLDLVLLLTTLAFAVEYVIRIWIAAEEGGASDAGWARWRYISSIPGIIDLIAAIPFALTPRIGLDLDWLDIVPIFKLLRYSTAFQFLVEAVYGERRVLGSAALLMLALLVFQSSLVYHFEHEAQPDKFASIPEAMWWGIVTLTTVGYGDVTPVTVWGRVLGGLTAVIGLAMFAIPVGIIASSFVEAFKRREFILSWNLVASVPLFQNLDASRIAAIAGLLHARRAAAGERLCRRGDKADSMYFIVSGEVDVDIDSTRPKLRLSSGEFFGEIALLTDRLRTATITATSPCRLLVLNKRDLHGFMASHSELAELVRETAARRLEELSASERT